MHLNRLLLYIICTLAYFENVMAVNQFNPDISLVLDGQFVSYELDAEEYNLPGFAFGGEAASLEEGFSLGHTELTINSNIDHLFYGQLSIGLVEHDGTTEVDLEEAYIETLGLGEGFSIRAGRFSSAIGYQNQQHSHVWDFADTPLIYTSVWGETYLDDGVRLSWLAPTELYLNFGVEAFSGGRYPAGGEKSDSIGSYVVYSTFGDDIGTNHSWQMGLSYFSADVINRESSSYANESSLSSEDTGFTGDSDVYGINLVYKWAPDGNTRTQNFKLQFEYFQVDESGVISLLDNVPLESSNYTGDQSGFYVQGLYQFTAYWHSALRFDQLKSSNSADDLSVLNEANLNNNGVTPQRISAMLEWVPSQFSRVRLQYNIDESSDRKNNQIIIQYTMSMGAHGAHEF